MLRIEPVQTDNQARFIRYAAEHGSEHDDSYLPGSGFQPSPEHPAYLLLREDVVIGAASLMRTPSYLQAGRSRFSIFHSTDPSVQAYSLLFGAIRRHFDGLRSVFLFLPESQAAAADAVRRLGFSVERYSYIMVLRDGNPKSLIVPEGYALHPIRPMDERYFPEFANEINANFDTLAGHLPMPADGLREWFTDETYLEDGIVLLLHGDIPVGTACVMHDYEDRGAADISALSVARGHRRKGLGRLLLKHAVCFAAWRGLRPVFLSLNAENDRALHLYRSEGFVVTEKVICFSRDCERASLASP